VVGGGLAAGEGVDGLERFVAAGSGPFEEGGGDLGALRGRR
jgi:hypothetical protein